MSDTLRNFLTDCANRTLIPRVYATGQIPYNADTTVMIVDPFDGNKHKHAFISDKCFVEAERDAFVIKANFMRRHSVWWPKKLLLSATPDPMLFVHENKFEKFIVRGDDILESKWKISFKFLEGLGNNGTD